MADYLPSQETGLVVWFADHAAGVATHGATVGLSAGEITQAADDAATVAHAINGRSLYESKKQEFTAYKDILLYSALNTPLPGTPAAPVVGALPAGALSACVARARQRAGQIKAHPAYTTAIGEDCRIVAPVRRRRGHAQAGAQSHRSDRLRRAAEVRDGRPRPARRFNHSERARPSGPPSASTPTAPTPTPAPRWWRASRKPVATAPAIATTTTRWASGATSSK